MKLQIAIDTVSAPRALKMADQIHDVIDIIEMGHR
jgi:3-keto-L-gulonate-6-phosphate decarboxylase